MCMFYCICGNTWRDKMRYEDICVKVDIASVKENAKINYDGSNTSV